LTYLSSQYAILRGFRYGPRALFNQPLEWTGRY
jgi:hypothetical protein